MPFDPRPCPLMHLRTCRSECADIVLHLRSRPHHRGRPLLIGTSDWRGIRTIRAARRAWRSPIPPLEYQYLDYADWQRPQVSVRQRVGRKLAYWKKELEVLRRLCSFPRIARVLDLWTYVGTRAIGVVPESLERTLALKALARTRRQRHAVQASRARRLSRHSFIAIPLETDIPVGTAIFGVAAGRSSQSVRLASSQTTW